MAKWSPVHFGNKTREGTQQSTFIRKSDRENVSETDRHMDRPRECSTIRSLSWLSLRHLLAPMQKCFPRASLNETLSVGGPPTAEFSCACNRGGAQRRPAKTTDLPQESNTARPSQGHRRTLRPAPGLGPARWACHASGDSRAAAPTSQRPGLPSPETRGARSSSVRRRCVLRDPRCPPAPQLAGRVPQGTAVGQLLLLSRGPSGNRSAAGASHTMPTKGTVWF